MAPRSLTARRATWSAPGRVNLIGEHTDYNDGLALPFAIPMCTTVHGVARDDAIVRVSSTGRDPIEFGTSTTPGEVFGWGAYVAGVVWAMSTAGHRVPGADLQITSEVPVGAGLSSSAALECAVTLALADLAALDLAAGEIVTIARRAENDFVGAPTGALDQTASMYGRAGHVVCFDARAMSCEAVPCDPEAEGLMLLVIDTGVGHRHAGGEYAQRRAGCADAAAQLGVRSLRALDVESLDRHLARLDVRHRPLVRHVVTENERVRRTVEHLRARRLREVGPLLTESHVSLRDDFAVSIPELDTAVDTALHAGALGARLTGGGFGGSVIALVPREGMDDVVQGVRVEYADRGFATPSFMPVAPSAGAGATSDPTRR